MSVEPVTKFKSMATVRQARLAMEAKQDSQQKWIDYMWKSATPSVPVVKMVKNA